MSPMTRVFFEDDAMRSMERALDLAVQRQSLISSNLANVDTPGYKTVDLEFETELASATGRQENALTHTNIRHMSSPQAAGGPASVRQVEGLTIRNDLNNVNVDREMAQLSTNALKFSMVAQMIASKFRTLKSALSEGR
jgi:flagellar basal-body rod protein FlgB